MGLLDQILGGATRGGTARGGVGGPLGGMLGGGRGRGGLGSKLAMGVVLALLVKAAREHSRPQEGRSFEPGRADQAGGGLGGMLGGGGLGGLLGGLGGAGALGGLIGQLQQRGLGAQANSWVSTGQNQPVAPHQLADALGEDTIEELQQHTGLPRETLLADLARELPDAVNQATPDGQLPDDERLKHLAGG